MVPEQRNFKLYKAKKQWVTACATFLLTFGATAVVSASANADSNSTSNGESTPKTVEVVQTANETQGQSNNAQTEAASPVAEQSQTASNQSATAITTTPATQAVRVNDSRANPQTATKDATENIASIPYDINAEDAPYTVAGSNLTNLAAKFIKNADALTQAGATFSWVGDVPTVTQQDALDGTIISGTVKVTYADGTSKEVSVQSYVEAQSQL